MTKIVAFIFDLSVGGAQGVLVNVANHLAKKDDIDIEIVVQNLNNPVYKDELNPDIRITNLQVNSTKEMLKPLKKFIASNDFDYAFAFSPEIAVNLVWARKSEKKNYTIVGRCINTLSYEFKHASSFFRRVITRGLVKRFYHKVDYAVAQSQGMADDLINNFKFKQHQIVVINNAMNPNFENEANLHEIEQKDDNYILYVGRFEEQKGLNLLLDAASKMKNETVKFFLLGSGSKKEELEKQAISLKLDDRVVFIDYTRDVMKYFKGAKFTVLSSYYEGFPNVLVESIACGTPVVAFDLPSGPKEIIIEGENGYLVEYLNCEQLAEKMDMALNVKWDERVIKDTAMRYSRANIMKKYENLFISDKK